MAHILLPTDMSERSLEAATLAIDLFGADGSMFTLVHVFSPAVIADPLQDPVIYLAEVCDKMLLAFEERLRGKCDLTNAKVYRIAIQGPLSAVVNEVARQVGVDLVVMAAGDRGASFLGGHTVGLMQAARVPVLEVPAEVTSLRFQKILFADDRSTIPENALNILATVAHRTRAEIVVVHVATGRPANDLVDSSALFDRVFTRIRRHVVIVENDKVADSLFDVVQREHVDLIVMLHRHRGLWDGLFHASVTKAMALNSTVAVLALEE